MRMKKYIIFLAVILLLVSSYFALDKLIKINKITCESQFGACSTKISEKAHKGKGMGLLSAKKTISDEFENEFWVKDYSFHYQLTGELIVNVVERSAKYAVYNPSIEWVALIDEDGYGLSLEESSQLPVLTVNEPSPNPGERVSQGVLFALQIFSSLEKSYNINSARVEDGRLVIELERGINVLFPLEGDRQVLLGSFIFIYNQAEDNEDVAGRLDAPEINTIDLRFKNPVIR